MLSCSNVNDKRFYAKYFYEKQNWTDLTRSLQAGKWEFPACKVGLYCL